MAKRMLVDATHPEETRVAVVSGNKLEELDFEIASKKQLKGNIYLAKVVRVEPSLQAAFVEYGGNRHGFLAFSEIHPDYYRIPVADREALLAEEEALARQADANGEAVEARPSARSGAGRRRAAEPASVQAGDEAAEAPQVDAGGAAYQAAAVATETLVEHAEAVDAVATVEPEAGAVETAPEPDAGTDGEGETGEFAAAETGARVEEVGGDEVDEVQRRRVRPLRSYKIQEVIKRRQVLLVQVVKEERGNKGAALTTYLSLPGRYCVLMPNTPRGGGVSRKITNPAERKRMKEILSDLDIPEGMAVILRTAGLERSKAEIKRDLEYLLRLWDNIRELTLQSIAPALIYEEANLIKRAIRDLYSNDIDEVLVEGETGYRTAKDFMRMLMPSHAKKVQPYRDESIPLFHRYQVESQIDAIHSPVVQLRSGGYIVLNQTEALVAIDVNSGRATRERNIEETALKTNLEAAEEIARQLRLRDLAGLIVIDFIDMEDQRNVQAVERRLREAMKSDRARIQLGRISPFGLLELSRQRLRPSLIETNFERCPHCAGSGLVRTTESAALVVLRAIEEEGIRRRSSEITVHVAPAIALYILNQKREALGAIERRYGFRVFVQADASLVPPEFRLERIRARSAGEDAPQVVSADKVYAEGGVAMEGEGDTQEEAVAPAAEEAGAEGTADEGGRRRRKRRRRRGNGAEEGPYEAAESAPAADSEAEAGPVEAKDEDDQAEDGERAQAEANGDAASSGRKKRRRGKRGGRRRSRSRELTGELTGELPASELPSEADAVPVTAAEATPAEPAETPTGVPYEEDLGDIFGEIPPLAPEGAETDAPVPPEATASAKSGAPAEAPSEPPGTAIADVESQATVLTTVETRVEAAERVEVVEVAAPVADEPGTEAAPAEPAPPKRRTRRRKTEAAAAETAEGKSAAGETAPPAEAQEVEAAPKKPARRRTTRKKVAAAAEEPAAQPTAASETPEAPAREAEPAPQPAPAAPPEADVGQTEEPTAGRDQAQGASRTPDEQAASATNAYGTSYEVVNQPPAKPRRGWWQRLMS